jgi:Baseplate J-like protein
MTFNNNPQKPENRPGLPQLVYRITDYNASRKWLLSLLRDSLRPDRDEQPGPLFNLTTRDQDDTGVAILDAWAVMADVLTFYQERIANEGYLRTATERRSVLELARMIGYELDPGVAASTYLAFTLEDATDSAETATIPQGTQVMSIPGEDELPQTFETSEEFIARVDWNNLQPRTSRPQNIWSPTKQNPNVNRQLYFKGVNTQLKPGDFILLLDQDFQGRRYLLLLADVNVNASEDYTVVNCQKAVSVSGVDLPETKILLQNPQVFAFQQKAFLFGYDAPTSVRVFVDPATTLQTLTWSDIQNSLNNPTDKLIDLDSLYGQILKDSWIVLYDTSPTGVSTQKAYTIANTLSVARARSVVPVVSIPPANSENLGQISLVTRVELNADKIGNARSTIVLAQSELLELVPEPLIVNDRQVNIFQDPIQGKTVFLREFVQKLHRDQTLMVSGQRIRAQLKDVGGVLKSVSTTSWEKINNGLTNSQIRSLAIKPDNSMLLAGTTEGIFFCQNDDVHQWQPVLEWNSISKTLEAKAIQALNLNNDFILVGTAQGLFTAVHRNNEWESKPVITSDVRVIYIRSSHPILIGTVNGGVLQLQSSNEGLTWRTTGLNNTDVQSLITVESNYTFAGTINDGIFRSSDPALLTWEKITSIRKGLGTITTNGNIVQGDSAANFQMQLQSGDVINVGDQSRSVLEISSNQQLTIDCPFRPDLTTNTSFTIDTGLTNRNITALGTKSNFVFAGTAGSGIFRSEGGNNSLSLGDRWRAVNTGLTDLEIRCLAIADNSDIWVGTSKDGVFRSTNNGESWEAVSKNLTNLDVRAILPPTDQRSAFVGGIGILQTPPGSYPIPMQRGDILQVLEPPAAIPGNSNYRLWKLMDKEGFQGDLITTTDSNSPEFENEITLLPALEDSTVVSEIAMVQNPPIDQQHPILTLQHSLQYAYDPATVRIYANVVPATHGETSEEVLGSGDGHLSNQRFGLNKPPLTYVPATNARGSASSLGLRVNGVLWSERPSLYPLQSFDQNYILRIQDDGSTIITFGDGTKGARLPSGLENITATYRSGIGLEGNLIAEQLSLLKTRPLGVSEVINPLPATGGAPRESLTEARVNAPATVRTLDRIVSIRDFTDFAQGFAGIGKAQALPLWNGETQMVHITIAAGQGNAVFQDSNLYTKLVAAIEQARDPIQQVQVDSYERLLFNIAARLLLDSRYEAKVVNAKIYHTLKTIFAFEQRQFSQDVTAAEVIAAIQTVAGVIAVDLDALYQVGRSKARERSLPALSARYDVASETIKPAQLLQLNPAGIQLTIVSTL